MNDIIEIYCDGAVSDNWHRENNRGGWAAIIKYKGKVREIESEVYTDQTNNRMELMPLVVCLPEILQKGIKEIKIISDSKYVLNGLKIYKTKKGSRIGYTRKLKEGTLKN